MILALAVLLAASGPSQTHPSWLPGEWGGVSDDGAVECGDHSIVYDRDGRYSLIDRAGTWRIEGDRLCERDLVDLVASQDEDPATTTCRAIRRTARGIEIQGVDGATWKMARCGDAAIPPELTRRIDQAAAGDARRTRHLENMPRHRSEGTRP